MGRTAGAVVLRGGRPGSKVRLIPALRKIDSRRGFPKRRERDSSSRVVGGWRWRRRSGCARISMERSEEHTSELQSLMRTSYAVFCLKKKTKTRKSAIKNHDDTSSLHIN